MALDAWTDIGGSLGSAGMLTWFSIRLLRTLLLRLLLFPPSALLQGDDQVDNGEEYVVGILYTLDAVDKERLDRAEGCPYAYTKHMPPVHILKPSPHIVYALAYVDDIRIGEGVFREEYVKRLNRGIRDAVAKGIENEYVERVLRRFVGEDAGWRRKWRIRLADHY